jgi:hypothetical protein
LCERIFLSVRDPSNIKAFLLFFASEHTHAMTDWKWDDLANAIASAENIGEITGEPDRRLVWDEPIPLTPSDGGLELFESVKNIDWILVPDRTQTRKDFSFVLFQGKKLRHYQLAYASTPVVVFVFVRDTASGAFVFVGDGDGRPSCGTREFTRCSSDRDDASDVGV